MLEVLSDCALKLSLLLYRVTLTKIDSFERVRRYSCILKDPCYFLLSMCSCFAISYISSRWIPDSCWTVILLINRHVRWDRSTLYSNYGTKRRTITSLITVQLLKVLVNKVSLIRRSYSCSLSSREHTWIPFRLSNNNLGFFSGDIINVRVDPRQVFISTR